MKTKLLLFLILFFTLNIVSQNISLVKDINPGAERTIFGEFKVYNGNLIFYATTESNGGELWISDGTENGTRLLQDINPGNGSSTTTSSPGFTEFQNKLFFNAFDDTNGYELWVTDGTTTGTKIIDDINPGNNSSNPKRFISIDDNTLYFNAHTQTHSNELWRTDGTANGTYLVTDHYPGTVSGAPGDRIVLNGKIFFSVSNPTENDVLSSGKELRVLNNFSIGLIKDINPGTGSSNPGGFFRHNDKIYFSADDGEKGIELWVSDGTEDGTELVKDINDGSGNSLPKGFTLFNNSIYFTALSGQLWKTNGTENGTELVKDINPNGVKSVAISRAVEYAGNLFFWADDGASGMQLWATDGTSQGTRIIKIINNSGDAKTNGRIKIFNSKMYFIATDGVNGYKLWESDGTEQGTKMVEDNSDVNLSFNYAGGEDGVIKQDDLHIINNKLFFIGYNSSSGEELFMYDPNAGKTHVPDDNFEQALIDLGYDDVLDNYVTTTNINTITNLNLENKNISNLTGIEAFTSLKNLNVKNNVLASIDLSMLTTLEELNCAKNEITNLNIKGNQSLKKLYCENNRLSNLDISDNTHLQTLNFHSNSIEQINIINFLQLETLICRDNMLTSLDISTNSNLHTLSAINNSLDCIQVSNVTDAITNWSSDKDAHATFSTDCSDVWTINVDPTLLTSLHSINGLDANNDGSITLAEAAALTGTLDLSNRGITNVEGLQAFTGISTLNLSGNSITDLSPLTGLSIEVISRTSGESQRVSTNTMSLENLIINNNSFSSLNLNALTSLKTINITNNPDLITVSIKNGNNASITSFDSSNTPKLTCILVDDKDAAYLNNWTLDAANSFASDEADCSQRVLSTNKEILEKNISIYPNPVKDILNINLSNQVDLNNVTITNVIGKIVLKSVKKSINTSQLSRGIYLLKIETNKGSIIKKIVKN